MMQNILLLIGCAIAAPLSDSVSQDYTVFKTTDNVESGQGHQKVTKSSLLENRLLVRRVVDPTKYDGSKSEGNDQGSNSSSDDDDLKPWDEGYMEAQSKKTGKSIRELVDRYSHPYKYVNEADESYNNSQKNQYLEDKSSTTEATQLESQNDVEMNNITNEIKANEEKFEAGKEKVHKLNTKLQKFIKNNPKDYGTRYWELKNARDDEREKVRDTLENIDKLKAELKKSNSKA